MLLLIQRLSSYWSCPSSIDFDVIGKEISCSFFFGVGGWVGGGGETILKIDDERQEQ